MAKLDAQLRAMLTSEVGEILRGILEGSEEKWINSEQLSAQFAFFTPSWLKRYGQTLPRTQAVVNGPDGEHKTGWCYPLHRIQRMVQEGTIKNLQL